jgi:hypothetical protein
MNKKTAGFLIGVGAGLGAIWALRDHLTALLDASATIELKSRPGGAGVNTATEVVKVKQNHRLTWTVINNSTVDVLVSIQNWTDGQGQQRPPAVNPDVDGNDPEEPHQEGLTRRVPAGKRRKIRGKGRAPQGTVEEVHYAIFLDGQAALDPIVRLVL